MLQRGALRGAAGAARVEQVGSLRAEVEHPGHERGELARVALDLALGGIGPMAEPGVRAGGALDGVDERADEREVHLEGLVATGLVLVDEEQDELVVAALAEPIQPSEEAGHRGAEHLAPLEVDPDAPLGEAAEDVSGDLSVGVGGVQCLGERRIEAVDALGRPPCGERGEDRDFGRNLRRDADAAGEDERDHLAREVHVRRPPAPARHDGVERAPEARESVPRLAQHGDRRGERRRHRPSFSSRSSIARSTYSVRL